MKQQKYVTRLRSVLLVLPLLLLSIVTLQAVASLIFPPITHAAIKIDPSDVGLDKRTGDDFVKNTVNGVYTIVGVIAVVVIVIGGFMFVTADGDAQKVATARRMILYAVIGLVIVLFAFVITGIIQGIGRK